jgi:hypothetical protein
VSRFISRFTIQLNHLTPRLSGSTLVLEQLMHCLKILRCLKMCSPLPHGPKKTTGGKTVVPQKSTKMLSAAVHRPQRLPAPGQCPPWQSVASCRPSAGDRKEGPDDASGGLSPPPAQGLLHVLNVCVCTIIHILSILQYNKTITDNNHKNEIQHYVIQYNVMYNVMHNIIQCNII